MSIIDHALAGQRVLVTGATGFIGGRLAQRLALEESAVVTGAGRQLEKAAYLADAGVTLRQADVSDTAAMQAIIQEQDVVFHAAAWLASSGEPQTAARRTNVAATVDMVWLAAQAGVGRFVHLSSIAVYGPPRQPVITENHPLHLSQRSPYGRTKAEGELAAMKAATEANVALTLVRPGMVYGPGSPGWSIRVLEFVKKGWPVIIGGGQGYIHPIFIDNLVDGLLLAAVRPQAAGEAFHFCDTALSWRDFFSYYSAMCGRRLRGLPLWLVQILATANEVIGLRIRLSREYLAYYTSQSVYSMQKAEERLGYRPCIDLEEGMRRTEAWLRQAGYLAVGRR